MKIQQEIKNKLWHVQLDGDLISPGDSLSLVDATHDVIQEGIINAVIDLSKVRFMNSSGIGTLVSIYTKFKNKQGEAVLYQPSEQVVKVLSITKLDSIIPIAFTWEEVLAKFN